MNEFGFMRTSSFLMKSNIQRNLQEGFLFCLIFFGL
jgi:hypothetical protein